MGYSPWGHKELDTTERLSTHTHTHTRVHTHTQHSDLRKSSMWRGLESAGGRG